jgi:hypothetical protein
MARRSREVRRIEAREAELLARLKADRAELEELRVARRVLDRLSGDDDPDLEDSEGSPGATIGELAFEILYEAKRQGLEGLTSNDLLELIREHSLPDLMRTSLSPPLSRLKKRGLIEQVGDLWRVSEYPALSNG